MSSEIDQRLKKLETEFSTVRAITLGLACLVDIAMSEKQPATQMLLAIFLMTLVLFLAIALATNAIRRDIEQKVEQCK